jgi:HEAT repeat protein
LEFATDSSLILRLVWWADVALLGVVLLLTFYLVALRALFTLRRRRERKLQGEWQPLLIEAVGAVPERVPRLRRRDAYTVLTLWNFLHESLRAEAKERLNEVARRAGMHSAAERLLREGQWGERLLAVITLGQLRERRVWGDLLNLAADENQILSLAAARALMRTDAARAVKVLMPLIVKREDWSPVAVAAILKEAGADVISAPLAAAARRAATTLLAPPPHAPRLIRYLELAHQETMIAAVRDILRVAADTEVVTACLKIFSDPDGLDTVRARLDDPRWQVRVQAVVALGRLGTAEDITRLTACLYDAEWWVRYRAAQALAKLPTVTPQQLSRIAESQTSTFARDIIRQVSAERQFAHE